MNSDQINETKAQPKPTKTSRMLRDISTNAILEGLSISFQGVSIMVWDFNGTILFANDVVARGFRKPTVDELLGMNISELAPPAWANERIKISQQSIQANQSITLMEIIGGYRLRSHFRPLANEAINPPRALTLVTVEKISAYEYDYLCVNPRSDILLHANYNDLGKLDILTNRELEVLALMGQGLRAKDIAKQLSRSVSTIDKHRDNMGEKLGISDRSEIIAMAHLAVLQVEDASRQRVQFSKYIPEKSADLIAPSGS